MSDELIKRLRKPRADFEAECRRHRFLVDAYTGGGGFASTDYQQPASGFWGPIAELYAATSVALSSSSSLAAITYLDKYGREDETKFQARRRVAHYPNYVEPLTDLKNSYLLRKEFTRQSEPDRLKAWREDMDGNGAKWADMRPGIVLLASLVGWCPVLVDRPALPADVLTRAQAKERGLDRTNALPLSPANLLDYGWKDGRFTWAKVRICRVETDAWDSEPVSVEEITVWTEKSASRWEIRRSAQGAESVLELGEFPHPFGRVPIAIFRHKRSPGRAQHVAGHPMHEAVSLEARRLYNLTSEMDEHIRGQVFALLVYVGQAPETGEKSVGVENGITLGPDSKNVHYYLAPPASVAATLETRIENSIREGFRMARTEYSRPVGGPTSGTARAYEFEGTNRAIADYGAEVARGETDLAHLVGIGEGCTPDELAKHCVIAPEDYGVQDLDQEIKAIAEGIGLKLGATAEVEIKKRVRSRLLPQLPAELMKKSDAELEEIAKEPPPAPPPIPGQLPPVPPKGEPPVPVDDPKKKPAPPKAA